MFTELEPGVVQHHCEADMDWKKSTYFKSVITKGTNYMYAKLNTEMFDRMAKYVLSHLDDLAKLNLPGPSYSDVPYLKLRSDFDRSSDRSSTRGDSEASERAALIPSSSAQRACARSPSQPFTRALGVGMLATQAWRFVNFISVGLATFWALMRVPTGARVQDGTRLLGVNRKFVTHLTVLVCVVVGLLLYQSGHGLYGKLLGISES